MTTALCASWEGEAQAAHLASEFNYGFTFEASELSLVSPSMLALTGTQDILLVLLHIHRIEDAGTKEYEIINAASYSSKGKLAANIQVVSFGALSFKNDNFPRMDH